MSMLKENFKQQINTAVVQMQLDFRVIFGINRLFGHSVQGRRKTTRKSHRVSKIVRVTNLKKIHVVQRHIQGTV